MILHRPNGVNINIRKVSFDFEVPLPVNWFPANGAVQLLFNILSLMFPAGERFFINSVKHYRARITDPALQKDVAAFIAQESMHTQQHLKCNQVLKSRSEYAAIFEMVPEVILKIVSRVFPARTQLAVTCALEHFTALLSDQLLQYSVFHKDATPVYKGLWVWHAIEESEHKAVCFDVYQYFCGGIIGYIERCVVMFLTSLVFLLVILFGFITVLLIGSMKRKGRSQSESVASPRNSLKKLKEFIRAFYIAFLTEDSVVFKILRPYFSYYRPSFHPWEYDNSALIQRRKLDLENGFLSDDAPQPMQEEVVT